jgi:hypothetical protein
MPVFRWQWVLANGGAIDASIDSDAGTETVSQEGRVLSQSPRGKRPDGHVVLASPNRAAGLSERPPIEVVVTFAPSTHVCVLRVDGEEVAPSVWPGRERPAPEAPPRSAGPWIVAGVAAVALALVGASVRALRGDTTAAKDGALLGVHRSPDGRFIAHFPADLEARAAVMPSGVTGALLENKDKSTTLVIASVALDPSASHDPWALNQMLHDEALANLPKGTSKYDEGARREETCLGSPGAVVVGQLLGRGARKARVWSCAFAHDDTGYFVLSMLSEPVEAGDDRRAKSILEATELTHLAEIGAAPKE